MAQHDGGASPEVNHVVVLVVDDEPVVRMIAVDLFEDIGCEVIDAGSGTDALARLEERSDITLMFTDCRMPGMSGPELAEAASRRWPQLKIVFTTGYCDFEVSGWPLVPKPYDTLAIERILAGVI